MAKDYDKVAYIGGETNLAIDPDRVLHFASQEEWEGVVVVGYDTEGNEHIFSSYSDKAEVLWLLERVKHHLMHQGGR